MIEEITAWINSGRNYAEGVALYEKYGSSGSLKRLLRVGGPTKGNIDSLDYELGKLGKSSIPPKKDAPIHRPVQPPPAPPHVEPPVVRRPNTSEVDELSAHVIDLMKVRDRLHSTLEFVKPDQRRKDAIMILDISDEITECYVRLDHYNKHGVLPPDKKKDIEPRKKIAELSPVELIKLQGNLRTYVSRYKKLMESAKTNQIKAQHQHKMERYQLQLAECEKNLRK